MRAEPNAQTLIWIKVKQVWYTFDTCYYPVFILYRNTQERRQWSAVALVLHSQSQQSFKSFGSKAFSNTQLLETDSLFWYNRLFTYKFYSVLYYFCRSFCNWFIIIGFSYGSVALVKRYIPYCFGLTFHLFQPGQFNLQFAIRCLSLFGLIKLMSSNKSARLRWLY